MRSTSLRPNSAGCSQRKFQIVCAIPPATSQQSGKTISSNLWRTSRSHIFCRSAISRSFCVFSPTIGNLHLARPSRESLPGRRRAPRRKEDLIPTRVAACVCEQAKPGHRRCLTSVEGYSPWTTACSSRRGSSRNSKRMKPPSSKAAPDIASNDNRLWSSPRPSRFRLRQSGITLSRSGDRWFESCSLRYCK